MGQGSTRIAIADALTAAQFPLVGTVYRGRTYINETDYEANEAGYLTESAEGGGCVVVVNLPGPDRRYRIALTGRASVDDMNIHTVVLELFFANTSGDPLVAQDEYDSVVDAIVPFIRNNPTMSAPEAVWSAGEFKAGVVHSQSSPYTGDDGTTVFITGSIKFESWEQIVGPNGV